MIAPLAQMLRVYIQTLNFADRVGGLARATKVQVRDGENVITKTIPMVKDDFEDCESAKMVPILPDTNYKSVHFFELSLLSGESGNQNWGLHFKFGASFWIILG